MASTVTAIDGRVVGDLTAQLLRAVTEPDYELAISMFSDPSFCKSTAACTAFLRVLAECGHGQHLLEVLIDREVAAETQPQMLFRRNTVGACHAPALPRARAGALAPVPVQGPLRWRRACRGACGNARVIGPRLLFAAANDVPV